MIWCPKIHFIIFLSILKVMRFGDIDLAVKLNYADLWCLEASFSVTRLFLGKKYFVQNTRLGRKAPTRWHNKFLARNLKSNQDFAQLFFSPKILHTVSQSSARMYPFCGVFPSLGLPQVWDCPKCGILPEPTVVQAPTVASSRLRQISGCCFNYNIL